MSSVIAIVKSIVGQVFALSADGVQRLLIEGDRLLAGDQVLTGQTGSISLELADGRSLDLGRDSQWTAEPATPPTPEKPAVGTSASELQQAITAGLDPTTELEAPAAGGAGGGGAGGGGGGHSAVVLDATAAQVDATAGFATQSFGAAAGGVDEQSSLTTNNTGSANLGDTTAPLAPTLALTSDT
ncbi:MAG: retention module-containing protein, partial [Pseudomonas sp.]|uniref:retention module-containing protein n=1 Tax=Pseudomonas sp. TaxID=306 RepID=UPI003BB4989F